ncbi:MAG: dynamin family protein [Pseudomonadota bacterium]
MEIAPLQKKQLDYLRGMLSNIESTVDRGSREQFRTIGKRLNDWAARVAVIGQVKAGKSTFLNAFIRQHDFLPSDINPWTSVVTNIRINMPDDPPMGASFQFFDETDWDEIMTGSDRIRKLTEDLLPGFDSEVLQRQTQEMRDRAQRRLGKHYHALLGSKHEYDFLSPDLLKRYVCAGPGSDDGLTRESLGRYAAITKVADVYMPMPEFLVPTIVTDTPGVNDPFLVRDEFTCRSLDKSDVFVVVLSAHQALTDVDIALIRMLAQQDSKDVMIFVNRIDELDDYKTQVPRVLADVSARLMEAIPDIEFTILAGSAYLADLVFRTDDEAEELRDQLDTPELAEYIYETYGEVPLDCEDRLLLASGLSQVKETLSTIIDNGIGCAQLSQVLGDIRAELNGVTFAAKRERESVARELDGVGAAKTSEALEVLSQELEETNGLYAELEAKFESNEQEIEQCVATSWSQLEKAVNGEIEAFVNEQREVFKESVVRTEFKRQSPDPIEIELTPLQVKLETVVSESFDQARALIDSRLDSCMNAFRAIIENRFEDEIADITLEELPYDEFTTTLTMAKKTLELEFVTEKNWMFWRRGRANVEKTVDALKTVAAAEFRPSVEKLLAAYNDAQAERAAAGSERIAVMLRMMETAVRERTQRLSKDQRLLEEVQKDPQKLERMMRRLQSQLEVLDRRLQHLSAADSSLSNAELSEAA